MPDADVRSLSRARPNTAVLIAGCVILSCAAAGFTHSGPDHGLSGRVEKDDGSPLAGAKVFVTADPSLQQTTDENGQFQFSETETERLLAKAAADKPRLGLDLVAVSDQFGLDWIKVRKYATNSSKDDLDAAAARNITLRLVKDLPIHGRFVDTDGNPIQHVQVELGQVIVPPQDDLTRWLKRWETSKGETCWRLANLAEKRYKPLRVRFLFPAGRPLPVPAEPGLSTTVASDKEGRLVIRGIGRERAVALTARHPDFVTKTFFVATREKFTLKPVNTTLPPLHSATFTQTLAPAKTATGIVREQGTGKPLADAKVFMENVDVVATATTAADGTFEIPGLGEKRKYRCVVTSASGQPHLRRAYWITGTPGLHPLEVGVELFRGTVVSGVVTNDETGEPLFSASLTYIPLPGNSNLDGLRESGDGAWDDRLKTGLDGTFHMAIPPGPGLIGVEVRWDRSADKFRRCSKEDFPYPLEEEEGEYYFKSATGRVLQPEQFHAVVNVNPTKDGSTKPLDIRLKLK